VGLRLSLWALARDYGRAELAYSSPFYKAMAVEGKRIRLTFAHTAGGLKSKDGKPLSEFQIAGADGKFVPAEAVIDKETIIVQSAEVPSPSMVRFAWSNAPSPNLVNAAGLPALPFHTDHWTGGTGE
jgi:sialate O-acetylesterase